MIEKLRGLSIIPTAMSLLNLDLNIHETFYTEHNMRKITLIIILLGLLKSTFSYAELTLLKEEHFSDSEEPFNRRIYSYDFDVTDAGIIHAVYAKPVPNEERSQVIYTSKAVGDKWPAEEKRTILEEFASRDSISTWLTLDTEGTSHISYIVNRDFIDNEGITHTHGLVYQTITNGVISKKINVAPGGFHTMQQLNNSNKVIFAREFENFLNADGTIRTRPFPKALRLLLPERNSDNNWDSLVLKLPASVDYRLAGFIYDKQRNRFHISYGNENAVLLRETYPTTNPPISADQTPVPFPAGAGHELLYAFSDNVIDEQGNVNNSAGWQSSIIDNSGNISENEFWTDMVLDAQGTAYVVSYRYATDTQGVQQGTSNIIGKFNGQSWDIQTVAGKTTGASSHRAGGAAKLLIDKSGGFHGIWDNSPDKPIDGENKPILGEVPGGGTIYRYSHDGQLWQAARQIILPFSVEGSCRVKLFNGKLLLMVLGDARDARVVFAEFSIPAPNANLFEVSSDKMFYGVGETINLHARIQGGAAGELFVVAAGPFVLDSVGNLMPVSNSFQYSYLTPDFTWQPFAFSDLGSIFPVIKQFTLAPINVDFSFPIASSSAPFINPGRYVIYSTVNTANQPIDNFKLLTPLYRYEIHICNQVACAEL